LLDGIDSDQPFRIVQRILLGWMFTSETADVNHSSKWLRIPASI